MYCLNMMPIYWFLRFANNCIKKPGEVKISLEICQLTTLEFIYIYLGSIYFAINMSLFWDCVGFN